MNSSPTRTGKYPKEEYNNIPVHCCMECLSLKIMRVAGIDEACYCDECGCTDIGESSISEWENLYKKNHGFTFLNNTY